MDASGDQPRAPGNEAPPERKGAGPPRARGGPPPLGGGGRPAPETRRKRSNEQRFAGWGDGLDRTLCARAAHDLPATFPVASHAGAVTIPATVVARRPDTLLVCTFSHCGSHVWPDGEIVEEELSSVRTSGDPA